MAPLRRSHRDLSHHHPRIRKVGQGTWVWECSCGGSSRRSGIEPRPWPGAVVEALLHSQLIAP
jgi:hypothetical protein